MKDRKERLRKVLDGTIKCKSNALKVLLWKEGLKPLHCEECKWSKYSKDGRLPLELDHIDGNNTNNELSNLRVLCPNCHALQLTNCGCNTKNKNGRKFIRDKFGQKHTLYQKVLKDKRKGKILSEREIEERTSILKKIDMNSFGWVAEASQLLKISHTSVKRFVKKYYNIDFFERKPA